MQGRFIHHPDGWIRIGVDFITNLDLVIPYEYWEQIVPEYSLSIPMVGRVYDTLVGNIHYCYDMNGNQFNKKVPWIDGDSYIENRESLYQQYQDILEQERLQRIENAKPKTVEEAQNIRRSEIRVLAFNSISKTDWRAIRHFSQKLSYEVDSNTKIDMTDQEFLAFEKERQQIRDLSSQMEQDILNLNDVDAILTYDISSLGEMPDPYWWVENPDLFSGRLI